jgi:hypothetical protein
MATVRVGRPRIGKKIMTGAERVAAHAEQQRASGRNRLSVWILKEAIIDLREIAEAQGASVSEALERIIRQAKSR